MVLSGVVDATHTPKDFGHSVASRFLDVDSKNTLRLRALNH